MDNRDMAELKTELDEYGFVVLHNLIPRQNAERMATQLIEIMKKAPDADKLDQGLAGGMFNHLAPDDYDLFSTLLTNPIYLELAEHLLGPDFKCTDSGPMWTKPGAPAQRLHADVPVGWIVRNGLPVPDACFVVNALWMLSEFTRDNGATLLMPFSHRAPRLPRPGVTYRHLVAAEGPPGSVVIFNASIWHGRGANVTANQHRVGVSVFYFASWMEPKCPATNWPLMRRSVRDQLPPLIQKMVRHVDEDGVEKYTSAVAS
jgi:ectoine hydroxylase-related dioxygenase (phytanoyl-CoA dioxygenase family)